MRAIRHTLPPPPLPPQAGEGEAQRLIRTRTIPCKPLHQSRVGEIWQGQTVLAKCGEDCSRQRDFGAFQHAHKAGRRYGARHDAKNAHQQGKEEIEMGQGKGTGMNTAARMAGGASRSDRCRAFSPKGLKILISLRG